MKEGFANKKAIQDGSNLYLMLFCGLAFSISIYTMEADAQIESKIVGIYTYGIDLSISSGDVASISGFVRGRSGSPALMQKSRCKRVF